MSLVDTHLHLDFEQYDADRAAVVERAAAAGVRGLITIGINEATSRRAIALAADCPGVWASVGFHPNESDAWGEGSAETLRALAAQPRVVAIGEIGLDYYWDRVPRATQQRAFEAQLALAAELTLPIIVHDRDAHEDVMRTLRAWVGGLPADHPRGVLHFFSGDRAMAEEALSMGFYLGADGPLTFPSAGAMRELIAAIPLDRLLLETDAPFLAPVPHRGKRNEPAFLPAIAARVAELHGIAADEVARRTTRNAQALFGIELDA